MGRKDALLNWKKKSHKEITLVLENIWSWLGRWMGVGGTWHAEGSYKSIFLLLVRKEIIRPMHTLSVSLFVFK